jgi:hypothetical protein
MGNKYVSRLIPRSNSKLLQIICFHLFLKLKFKLITTLSQTFINFHAELVIYLSHVIFTKQYPIWLLLCKCNKNVPSMKYNHLWFSWFCLYLDRGLGINF